MSLPLSPLVYFSLSNSFTPLLSIFNCLSHCIWICISFSLSDVLTKRMAIRLNFFFNNEWVFFASEEDDEHEQFDIDIETMYQDWDAY